MNHIDLSTIHLNTGAHSTRDSGVCLLEAVSWWAEEDHDDHPQCVSPVLGAFGRAWNDALDDATRQRLIPFIPRLVGTAEDGADETRAWMLTDWLARVCAPAFLRTAGLTAEAERLEQGTPIIGPESALSLQASLDNASEAARAAWAAAGDAARAAARAAAGAATWAAAGAAARAATWAAAGAAARAAAGAAARAAAGAAARDAAGAAAWDAARAAAWDAARAAARAAAWDALKPTVERLQESAFDLLARMCDIGSTQEVSSS